MIKYENGTKDPITTNNIDLSNEDTKRVLPPVQKPTRKSVVFGLKVPLILSVAELEKDFSAIGFSSGIGGFLDIYGNSTGKFIYGLGLTYSYGMYDNSENNFRMNLGRTYLDIYAGSRSEKGYDKFGIRNILLSSANAGSADVSDACNSYGFGVFYDIGRSFGNLDLGIEFCYVFTKIFKDAKSGKEINLGITCAYKF
jgi:hypothetical protein